MFLKTDGIYYLLDSRGLFPEEQKGCRKVTKVALTYD